MIALLTAGMFIGTKRYKNLYHLSGPSFLPSTGLKVKDVTDFMI